MKEYANRLSVNKKQSEYIKSLGVILDPEMGVDCAFCKGKEVPATNFMALRRPSTRFMLEFTFHLIDGKIAESMNEVAKTITGKEKTTFQGLVVSLYSILNPYIFRR